MVPKYTSYDQPEQTFPNIRLDANSSLTESIARDNNQALDAPREIRVTNADSNERIVRVLVQAKNRFKAGDVAETPYDVTVNFTVTYPRALANSGNVAATINGLLNHLLAGAPLDAEGNETGPRGDLNVYRYALNMQL